MSYDEEEELGGGFKMTDGDELDDADMDLDAPADLDFGLDEDEDPQRDG